MTIIYVLGSGHCGSTLLDLIMDSHSQIVGVGELTNWPFSVEQQKKIFCTCDKLLSECPFWQVVFEDIPDQLRISNEKLEIYQKKIDFLFNSKKYVFSPTKVKKVDLDKYLKLNEEIYKNILSLSGKKVIFDSSKDVDRANTLSLSDKLEVIFLHLVRDGRGVSYSYQRKYGGIISPMLRWAFQNLKIEILKRRQPEKFIFVRYEDFCQNPKKEIEKILTRIGLDFEPAMLNFGGKIHHQAGGNRLRFNQKEEIEEDRAWQKKLPIINKLLFHILFGWLNKYYGY